MGERETAVLFAGIAGRDARIEEHLARVVETLAHAAGVSGGRMAARREREAMALFPSPDSAVRAALRLHAYGLTLPALAGRIGARMSVHCGPVGQRGEEVFGDTIDLALELLEGAGPGETLISEHAAMGVGPGLQRFIGAAAPGGKGAARLRAGQLLSAGSAEVFAERAARLRLSLAYRSKTVVRRREGDAVTVGSDATCDVAVQDSGASGRHCTILRSKGACILRDHSAGGTFVTVEDGAELTVRDAEIRLSGRGVISFGRPRARSEDVVQYACEG